MPERVDQNAASVLPAPMLTMQNVAIAKLRITCTLKDLIWLFPFLLFWAILIRMLFASSHLFYCRLCGGITFDEYFSCLYIHLPYSWVRNSSRSSDRRKTKPAISLPPPFTHLPNCSEAPM
jgi:hypothetical protein